MTHGAVAEPGEHRAQTLGEEIANSISHGIGLVAALVAAPFLIVSAVERGNALTITGVSIFCATMILLYSSSTIYHFLPRNNAKRFFRVMDHISIFLFIAGTYTPFTFGILKGAIGWTIFGLIWGLAALGVIVKLVPKLRHSVWALVLYLGMGWLIVGAIQPLWQNLPAAGLAWIIAGGMAYTVGVIFYVYDRLKYCHFIWHLFIVAGTACHTVAVLRYAV